MGDTFYDSELIEEFGGSYYDIVPVDYRLPPLGTIVEVFIEIDENTRDSKDSFLRKTSDNSYEWEGVEKDNKIIAWRQLDNFDALTGGDVIIVFCNSHGEDYSHAGFYDGDDGHKIELFISNDIRKDDNYSIERCIITKIIMVDWKNEKFKVLINEPEICRYG